MGLDTGPKIYRKHGTQPGKELKGRNALCTLEMMPDETPK